MHGIRATLKGYTAQLDFSIPNKSLDRQTRKEGSLNSPQKGTSFCENELEFQEVLVLDHTLMLKRTRDSVFLRLHHQYQKKKDTFQLTSSPWEGASFPALIPTSDPDWKIRVSSSNPSSSRRRETRSYIHQVSISSSNSMFSFCQILSKGEIQILITLCNIDFIKRSKTRLDPHPIAECS